MSSSSLYSVTIQQVAERAGVARSTASMALAGNPQIHSDTRERVNRAASELGYTRNPLVTSLMAKIRAGRLTRDKGTVIAVVSEELAVQWWPASPLLKRSYEGICGRAREQGYRIEHFVLGRNGLTPQTLLRQLRARGVQGVILAPLHRPGPSLFVGWEHFALAAFNRSILEPAIPCASIHHYHNFTLVWQRLCERGVRKVGFVQSLEVSQRNRHEYLGAYLAHTHAHLPASRLRPLLPKDNSSLGREQLVRWLRNEKPEVVVVGNSSLYEMVEGFHVSHLRGRVLSLECAGLAESVPGIDECPEAVGAATLDLVGNQLYANRRGIPESPELIHIPGRWREGAGLCEG